MKQDWERTLTAWRLAEAGRWDEAMDTAAPDRSLHALLGQRAFRPVPADDSAVLGWQSYYQGRYREALGHFLAVENADAGGWRHTWSRLGIAKVASDAGWWRVALAWCSSAWTAAAAEEHLDLLAQIAGARGEILLRAGRPLEAAAAFAEDRALLPPGSRYHGRVRCYEAHAWSRMGANGRAAAALAYRLALHSPGESATAAFAAAGLALLAAREDAGLRDEPPWNDPGEGLPGFWILVVRAHATTSPGPPGVLLDQAAAVLPVIHYAEHWWLDGWRRALGAPGPEPVDPREVFPGSIPPPPAQARSLVEEPVGPDDVPDAPWWPDGAVRSAQSPADPCQWWRLRDCFMP